MTKPIYDVISSRHLKILRLVYLGSTFPNLRSYAICKLGESCVEIYQNAKK